MTYYAVAADGVVVSVESTAQAALETMSAVANLRFNRHRHLIRFVTDERAFLAFSNGRALRVDYIVSDSRLVPIVVEGRIMPP